MNVKFGTGKRSTPCAKFHVYRGNVSSLRGEKPIFGLLSKHNGCRQLELNMHHQRGNAILAGPLSDSDENLFFLIDS